MGSHLERRHKSPPHWALDHAPSVLVAIDIAEWDAIVCDRIPRLRRNLAMKLVDEIVELASCGKSRSLMLCEMFDPRDVAASKKRYGCRFTKEDKPCESSAMTISSNAELYSREAEQRRLAADGMRKIGSQNSSPPRVKGEKPGEPTG